MDSEQGSISISRIERKITELREKEIEISAELRVWRQIRAHATANLQSAASAPSGDRDSPANERLGPQEAVVALLQEEPNLTTAQVVERLESVVKSRAKNVKRCLYSTIHLLKKFKTIVDNSGHLSLA